MLLKLSQTSSVRDYQSQFEMLPNRVVGLADNFLLSCFISGLNPHNQCEVQALQPINLMQTVDLAKLQEERFLEILTYQRSSYTSISFSLNQFTTSTVTPSSNPPLLPKPSPNISF